MKAFQRFSLVPRRTDTSADKKEAEKTSADTKSPEIPTSAPAANTTGAADVAPETEGKVKDEAATPPVAAVAAVAAAATSTSAQKSNADSPTSPKAHNRSFSIRALFTQGSDGRKQTSASTSSPEQSKPEDKKKNDTPAVAAAAAAAPTKPLTGSEKRAQDSAQILRSIIVGPTPEVPKPVGSAQLNKVKTLLMQPKSAKQIIAALRSLPVAPGTGGGTAGYQTHGPIHAVCLPYTEKEAHDLHFAKLVQPATVSAESVPAPADASAPAPLPSPPSSFPSVSTASIEAVATMVKNMHVVNLIGKTDLGIGEPGDGPGILSGSVPTAETVINGITQITPQLMALGFATGKILTPNHRGVYPPTDRMSVLTYWWGLELVMPHPTLVYLSTAESITSALINFLTVLSLIDNGVREILPFVRYIGQFVDFEFNAIKGQDKGKGVICAATWILPAAMVPRPWDFPPPPPPPPTPAVSGPSIIVTPATAKASPAQAAATAPTTT